MTFVLDCSMTLAVLMPDEDSVGALLDRLTDEGAVVPSLWKLEVGNALLVAERRGRIDAAFRIGAITDLMVMPVTIDPETDAQAWHASLDLAVRHRLSTYDAAYVELARRRRLPLATVDQAMGRAARAEEIALI